MVAQKRALTLICVTKIVCVYILILFQVLFKKYLFN